MAGEQLLHPLIVTAVAVLALNDHLLKNAYPGVVTGKLSDFAGLVFFPALLQALCEFAELAFRGRFARRRGVLLVAIALTALGFSWVKLFPAGAELYREAAGLLRWPFHALSAWWSGASLPLPRRVELVRDATDLTALAVLPFAWWAARRSR